MYCIYLCIQTINSRDGRENISSKVDLVLVGGGVGGAVQNIYRVSKVGKNIGLTANENSLKRSTLKTCTHTQN